MHAGGAWSRPCPTECAPRHVARRLAKEVEQADAAHQGGGQLGLHHELRQAGGWPNPGPPAVGGKEAHVSVQPASPRPSQLMVELWCVLENFSGDLLMLRLSLQELSLLMLAS